MLESHAAPHLPSETMFDSPSTVDVEVDDHFELATTGALTIRRLYRFIAPEDSPSAIIWRGRDAFPPGVTRFAVDGIGCRALGEDGSSPGSFLWEISAVVFPNEDALVSLIAEIPGCATANPFSLTVPFRSRWRVRYRFEAHSTIGLFAAGRTRVTIGDEVTECTFTTSGGVTLPRPTITSDNRTGPLSIRIENEPESYTPTRLMHYYTARATSEHPHVFADKILIIIPHLLRDSLSLFTALEAAGMKPENAFVVGIPYSTKRDVVRILFERGYRALSTPTSYPFLDSVRSIVAAAIHRCQEAGHRLLIVEDGGYAGPLLHSEFSSAIAICDGVVEQTRNGIWAYEGLELRLPILSVADSELKLRKESPLIGNAVTTNIRLLVENTGFALERYPALVVGYGATGSRVAESLRANGNAVVVLEKDDKRLAEAVAAGFRTGDSIRELAPARCLVVGCTGRESLGVAEILELPHGSVVANASSKRRELSYSELGNLTAQGSSWERLQNGLTRIRLVNDRDIFLLADGYPVNFVGESVPDEEISFIIALLFRSAALLASAGAAFSPGILDIPVALQEEIERHHGQLTAL